MMAIILTFIIVFLIGLIIGIYLREAINLFRREKPPDDLLGSEMKQIMNYIETGKEPK